MQFVAHTEEYLFSLHRLITLKLFDIESVAKNAFGAKKTEPVDVHFESMGFTTSDTFMNLSSIIGLFLVLAAAWQMIYLYVEYGPSENLVRRYLVDCKDGAVSYGFNLFLDWSFLLLAICCAISLC